jgi:hypothetical protein
MRGIAYGRLNAIGHILYDEDRHCLASLIIDPFIIMVLPGDNVDTAQPRGGVSNLRHHAMKCAVCSDDISTLRALYKVVRRTQHMAHRVEPVLEGQP